MKTIIDDDKTITVKSGNLSEFDSGNNIIYVNYHNQDQLLVRDNNFKGNIERIKPNTEIFPGYITYAHELIHSYHALQNNLNYDMKHYFYLDSNGNKHITGEKKLSNFPIYDTTKNRYYTKEEMYQILMNDSSNYVKLLDSEDMNDSYATRTTLAEMKDSNSEVYKFFMDTAEKKLEEAKKNKSKTPININVPFIKIAQEEFDTVGNKMGTRNNEPTENNIHNEHGRKEHNRGPYNGEIKW